MNAGLRGSREKSQRYLLPNLHDQNISLVSGNRRRLRHLPDRFQEVYGYARARQMIWTGFACNLIAVIAIWIGGKLPAAPFWTAVYRSKERRASR